MRMTFCVLLLALMTACTGVALATSDVAYNVNGPGKSEFTCVVTTTNLTSLTLGAAKYKITHLNIREDGTTASTAGDFIVIMNTVDSAGVAVTMVADRTVGVKDPVLNNTSTIIDGSDVPLNAAGARVIQMEAVTHGATILVERQ